MTLQDARQRSHDLLRKEFDIHPGVEVADDLESEESPSGDPETVLLVELSEHRRAVPSWVLQSIANYGLQLAPNVELEADRARLVVR